MTRLRKAALSALAAVEMCVVAVLVGVIFVAESLHTLIAGGSRD